MAHRLCLPRSRARRTNPPLGVETLGSRIMTFARSAEKAAAGEAWDRGAIVDRRNARLGRTASGALERVRRRQCDARRGGNSFGNVHASLSHATLA
ncbi:MAG TPA: hypothetical protein VFW19_08020 [Allosphingosinicella sp.]|nr:hypothetical protein [Allosphingosinicella sp.]